MEIPASIFGSVAKEGEIYFFEKGCPVGIENHPHILVSHNGNYLFLNTCSSSLDTAIRLARIRNWDNRTYPVIKANKANNLMRDSYINCNEFVELTETEFGNLTRQGIIHRDVDCGHIEETDMKRIREGINLSINISDEDKDRILKRPFI